MVEPKSFARPPEELRSSARLQAYAERLQRISVELRQEADALLLEAQAIFAEEKSDSH